MDAVDALAASTLGRDGHGDVVASNRRRDARVDGVPFKRHRAAHKGARFKQEQRRSITRVPDDVARRERRRPGHALARVRIRRGIGGVIKRPVGRDVRVQGAGVSNRAARGIRRRRQRRFLTQHVPNRIPQRLIHVVRQERDGGDGVVILRRRRERRRGTAGEEHLFLADDAVEFRQVVDQGVVMIKLGVPELGIVGV